MKYKYLITFLLLIGCSASSYKNTDLHDSDSFSKDTSIKDVVDIEDRKNNFIDQEVTSKNDLDAIIHEIREIEEISDISGDNYNYDINDRELNDMDATQDISTDSMSSVFCGKNEACNTPLLQDGSCPGQCIKQRYGLYCPGHIIDALCYPEDFTLNHSNGPLNIGSLYIEAVKLPGKTVVGEQKDLVINITNTSEKSVKVAFGFKNPGTWKIVQSNFKGLNKLALAPHETKVLSARLKAVKYNVLNPMKAILSFIIGDGLFEPYAIVEPPDHGSINCGGINFPAFVNASGPKDYFKYARAICCNNVFYPGAYCCTNDDCLKGACIDGHCIDKVPELSIANTLAHGSIRILIVIADLDKYKDLNPCIDSSESIQELPFKQVEDFYHALLKTQTGLDNIHFQVRVAAGLKSSDFIQGEKIKPDNYFQALKTWLSNKCGFSPDEYDKKIIVSPVIDLHGFAGTAFHDGWIGVHSFYSPYLLAHELAHTFGATDLYINMGGRFQYARALMNNYTMNDLLPVDALLMVMRGELGLTDSNLNGVVDIAEFAAYPQNLDAEGRAVLYVNSTSLEITLKITTMEQGVIKIVPVKSIDVTIPALGINTYLISGQPRTFVISSTQTSTLKQQHNLKIKIKLSYTFTDQNFHRETFHLNTDKIVPLTIK